MWVVEQGSDRLTDSSKVSVVDLVCSGQLLSQEASEAPQLLYALTLFPFPSLRVQWWPPSRHHSLSDIFCLPADSFAQSLPGVGLTSCPLASFPSPFQVVGFGHRDQRDCV